MLKKFLRFAQFVFVLWQCLCLWSLFLGVLGLKQLFCASRNSFSFCGRVCVCGNCFWRFCDQQILLRFARLVVFCVDVNVSVAFDFGVSVANNLFLRFARRHMREMCERYERDWSLGGGALW